MTEIYEYTDQNMKRDENILTVDFYFDSDVSKEDAVGEVDNIVGLADNKDNLKLKAHAPRMYTISPHNEEEK
tara:strand:+ start:51 stop:266 length:216 start_codon:yes stop_codon:yes gene_type:complete